MGTSGTNVLNVTNGLIGAGVASCTVTVGVALDPAVAIPAGGLDLTNGPAVPGGPTTGPGVITTLYLNSPSSATIKALPSADMLAVRRHLRS
ncbi:hypothetical protein [Diaphorobacter aerolatus]|uniref:Uncharacterized protein n=1 Tax=Diaphorobacter aerolatus TaxID=1288495 RepID=A0A7H0GI03_9BURK|nr:hypothetical protein [Diaphorobacter aerolatus]QNP47919.1 hypothetical protein H9K75_17610 [Diaphorobacter aerolatus]